MSPVKPVVYVVYYSMYGHIQRMAHEVMKGLQSTGKVDAHLFQVKETLSDEVLGLMKAPAKASDVPVLHPKDMVNADAFLFGIPTRYGNQPAQVRAFWDQTGGLWAQGALRNKMAGMFFSTGSQHGGQETTAFTFLTTMAHHGMIYVPIGFGHKALSDNTEVVGGSAYGSGTVANGDGSRLPTEKELSIAEFQGSSFADVVAQFHNGKK
ncbi:hypothetical protein H4219_003639 [Mycoemilia scoparia]|uniref:Flavodoxin-like domain-containing protein n=1 Tax=Mycoemilia scoparia TaxID=417184 RepID=A0A9W7ZU56_9FUNG|nr:hypothetical protein H4219_003639 [Mycoemilia scoparia]